MRAGSSRLSASRGALDRFELSADNNAILHISSLVEIQHRPGVKTLCAKAHVADIRLLQITLDLQDLMD